MELILMRHGTTQGNVERRFIGVTDIPLIPEGEALARQVGPTLPAVEHVFRSPLVRCRQTAELLWPGTAHTVVDDLRETDFGPFEGKNHEELKDDALYRAWLADGPDFSKVPVGESARAVVLRAERAVQEILGRAVARHYRTVGVVSHGGLLMALMAKFARPEREDLYDWMAPNCGGWRVKVEPDLTLTVLEGFGGATVPEAKPEEPAALDNGAGG